MQNTESKINKIVSFIQSTFSQAGFFDAVIAVSGGIDSAVSCALTVKALGPEHVYTLFLPYGELNQVGVDDARLVTDFLKIPEQNIQIINIQPVVDSFESYESGMEDIRKGNIMARMRMIYVFDQAKKRKALVVGTENKTEHYLGYFTRFGDEASDVEPLRELYKTQVYEVAENLQIPERLRVKAPTAGLWEGQTDEGEFGFTYADADKILSLMIDEKKSREEIIKSFRKENVVEAVLKRVKQNEFKHHLPFLNNNL